MFLVCIPKDTETNFTILFNYFRISSFKGPLDNGYTDKNIDGLEYNCPIYHFLILLK